MSASSRPTTIIMALTITAAVAAATALGVAATTTLVGSSSTNSKKKSPKRATNYNDDDDNNDDDPKFQIPRALLDSPYAAELKLAVRLALQAGRNMYPYCNAAGTVHAVQDLGLAIKGGRPEDFCTQIDVDNEHLITSAIQAHFPAHHIIGEEAVGSGEIPPLSNDIPTWIIDRTCVFLGWILFFGRLSTSIVHCRVPRYCSVSRFFDSLSALSILDSSYTHNDYDTIIYMRRRRQRTIAVDGTTNFAAGMPLTCVSIGYCVRGFPTIGVVYAPMTNELYLAVAGYGAYRNHVRLVLSSTTKKKCLKEAIVCYEFGYERDPTAIAKMVDKVQAILEHGCRATRSLGSGVLNLCYVASGTLLSSG
jgi:fructose-1,6-bisphosphatase/inositol monophosphatase family enzyme